MPNMQSSPRNNLLGFIADKLNTGKSFGNKYEILKQIPLIGGTGLGDLFLGNSPELADDMSYNLSSAIRGGNRVTGGLGTYTLDKRSADLGMTMADIYGLSKGLTSLGKYGAKKLIDKSGFDETRRAFLEGKNAGLDKPTNDVIVDTASSMLSPVDKVLQTPVSRRNVIKGVAAAGGLAATPTLLRNFVKDTEHIVPKVIEPVMNNHTYDSLAHYFADVDHYAHATDDLGHLSPQEKIRHILKSDEQLYTSMKQGETAGFTPDYIQNVLNQFSPNAKQEMKALKQVYGNDWYHPNIHDEVLSNGFGFGDSKNPLKDLQDIKANSGGTGYDTFMDNINYGKSIF